MSQISQDVTHHCIVSYMSQGVTHRAIVSHKVMKCQQDQLLVSDTLYLLLHNILI